jgi:hypothetical protein
VLGELMLDWLCRLGALISSLATEDPMRVCA